MYSIVKLVMKLFIKVIFQGVVSSIKDLYVIYSNNYYFLEWFQRL